MSKAAEIHNYVRNNRQEIIEILASLVAIPGDSGQEEEIARKIETLMSELDFDRVLKDEIGNVAGKIGRGPKVIFYDAHMDTVSVGDRELWTNPPTGKIDGDYLYGRGANDDRGCLAAMLYAGKIIKEFGLENDVTLYISASVLEETGEGVAVASFLAEKELEPDYVVIGEPSQNIIRRGHRGRAQLRARFSGKSVHASVHDDDNHAIYKALHFIKAIPELNQNMKQDPELGRGDICVTSIDVDTNSYSSTPASCEVIIDRRTTTRDTKESLLAELQNLPRAEEAEIRLGEKAFTSYTGKRVEFEEYLPAWVLEEDHPFVKGASAAYEEYFDRGAEIRVWPFCTNGAYTMGKKGIPTIGFGPGREQDCHIVDERIELNQVVEAAGFYALLPDFL